MNVRPGYTTTEFWLTLLTQIAAILAVVHPGFKVPTDLAPFASVAAMVATAVYTYSRGSVKRTALAAEATAVKAAGPAGSAKKAAQPR